MATYDCRIVVSVPTLFPARELIQKLGHGDWLTDEIRRSDRGLVLHEILFRTGNRWTLESADIVCRWEPIIAKPSV